MFVATCLHYCTEPDVTWGSGRGCPLVVHYWADMQSVHGLHCYGNITRMLNVSECMLVLTLCLVITVIIIQLMYNMFLQVFDERKALVGKWVSFALY